MKAEELLSGKRVIDDKYWMSKMGKDKVLVTGALGTIGRSIVDTLEPVCHVRGIDSDEARVAENPWCELGDFSDMRLADERFVFHTAAYKHVVLGEKYQDAFLQNNLFKTERLLKKLSNGTRMVFISTDKAAGNSAMGKSKKIAEHVVADAGHVAIRLVNIARSRGSVIDLWDRNGGVKYCGPRDVSRYFMQIQDCVAAILRAAFLCPGIYTVVNVPKFTLGELAEVYEKRGVEFRNIPLREGEVKEEVLFDKETEKLKETSVPYLARVVTKWA